MRMRTILDTSTGCGTACVIDVNGERDKNAIERIGLHTISMQDPELAIKAMVDAVIKCLSDDRGARGNNSRESCESGCFERDGTMLLQRQIRALRLDVEDRFGKVVGDTHQCVTVACETRQLAVEQTSTQTEWYDNVRKSARGVIPKPLMQLGA